MGEKVSIGEIRSRIQGESKEFRDSVERMVQHLEANEVRVNSATLTLGADLTMDPETESITNHAAASEMLTREYRTGFEVPNLAATKAASDS